MPTQYPIRLIPPTPEETAFYDHILEKCNHCMRIVQLQHDRQDAYQKQFWKAMKEGQSLLSFSKANMEPELSYCEEGERLVVLYEASQNSLDDGPCPQEWLLLKNLH